VRASVVIKPDTVLCPCCGSALHAVRSQNIESHRPPPETVQMRCLDVRCDEKGVVKLVPLPRIDVEIQAEEGEAVQVETKKG
jgi:hypothetical protein